MAAASLPACAAVSSESEEWQPLDWYAAPLYYDIVFEEETEREAAWLDELFALFGPPLRPSEPRATVLEPACGSGRLLRALLLRGYNCIGFDRQPAAVLFARSRCEAALTDLSYARSSSPSPSAGSAPTAALSSAAATALPACCVFEADLTSFACAPTVPRASIHMAHCLVSSLKYLLSHEAAMQHFAAVAASLVTGGLYVIAVHLCDYSDSSSSSSVDEHTAERGGVRVAMSITCEPPHRESRTERVRVRTTVTSAVDVSQLQQQQSSAAACSVRYRWEETMRTYDRAELWRLLAALSERWFDVLATFDYEQARHGRVQLPLEWPQPLHTFDASQKPAQQQQQHSETDWTGWEGVEAVAVVLRCRSACSQ